MMTTKMPAPIEKLTLNAATFRNVSVEPTLINFFYGNNGTGKSTIAQSIRNGEGLAWRTNAADADCSVLVYNREFVETNFRDYGTLKGVFTIGEKNNAVMAEISEKTARCSDLERRISEQRITMQEKEAQKDSELVRFQETCWAKTKSIRTDFSASLTGSKTKLKFSEKVLQISNPVHHDLNELRTLYETAFDPNASVYNEFRPTGTISMLKGTRGNELLSKPITSSSDTPFAEFIKSIQATDWVRQGHQHFSENTDGLCPYCQRALPDGFETEIAACFDKQYQADIDDLHLFAEAYRCDMQGFLDVLNENMQTPCPKIDLTVYKSKVALLEKVIEANIQRISEKLKEPSSVVMLENVKTLREDINGLIEGFNKQIRANNGIVRAKRQKQDECTKKVWECVAYMLQNEVADFRTKNAGLIAESGTLLRAVIDGENALRMLRNEIAGLMKQVVSTAPTMQSINALLRDSGFQGFSLREKNNTPNAYEVVRQNGTVAEELSEGERSFIAFLYFYHLVRGSHTDAGLNQDKIVVIDDPVSGMDSSILSIVGVLVRNLLAICLNNAVACTDGTRESYIKQIFVFTHNISFHRAITYNRVVHYHCVSFFVVSKADNTSSVKLCVRKRLVAPSEWENYNPVQNAYDALWSEYREVKTVIPTMRVIHQIMEGYFMQLCGYDCEIMRKRVLEEHKDLFADRSVNGEMDYTKLHLATAMLSCFGADSNRTDDDVSYLDDSADINLCRTVFRKIFEALGQEQHYRMMMNEAVI